MWIFELNSSCCLGFLDAASIITAKEENVGHFVVIESRTGEKCKVDGKRGDKTIQSSVTVFKRKEKVQVWVQQVSKEGQSYSRKGESPCPRAMQGEKDPPISLLPGRWGVHLSPHIPGWQQGPGGNRLPNVLFPSTWKKGCFGSIPPKQAQSYGQQLHGVLKALDGSWAVLNQLNALHKSKLQHTWNDTLVRGITMMHILYGIQHYDTTPYLSVWMSKIHSLMD